MSGHVVICLNCNICFVSRNVLLCINDKKCYYKSSENGS